MALGSFSMYFNFGSNKGLGFFYSKQVNRKGRQEFGQRAFLCSFFLSFPPFFFFLQFPFRWVATSSLASGAAGEAPKWMSVREASSDLPGLCNICFPVWCSLMSQNVAMCCSSLPLFPSATPPASHLMQTYAW